MSRVNTVIKPKFNETTQLFSLKLESNPLATIFTYTSNSATELLEICSSPTFLSDTSEEETK